MRYIELIGPQGAGKTTMLHNLLKYRAGREWVIFEEAVIEIAGSVPWRRLNGMQSKALWLLKKTGNIHGKELGVATKLLKALRTEEQPEIQKKYEFLIAAQIKALAETELDLSPINLFTLMNLHYRALDRNFLLEEFRYHRLVLTDEGPLKTHYGLHKIDPDAVDRRSLPAAVIYCRIGKKENVKRIMQRFDKTGRLSRIHNELNNDNIREVTLKLHNIHKKNLEIIKQLRIPLMILDMQQEIDPHAVQMFIRDAACSESEA